MSASTAKFGFSPSYHPSGKIRCKAYKIATGYATAIFKGDPVKLVDAGVVNLAAAGDTMLGIFAGVEYTDSTGKPTVSNNWPASTAATDVTCWVWDDPETLFEVEFTNTSSGTTIQADIGETTDHIAGSGNTTTGISGAYIGALGQGGFQITGIAGDVNDAITDAYIKIIVRINEHHYKYPTASV